MVVYPEGVWYRHVQVADVPEIVGTHLIGGRAVERLMWSDSSAMKALAIERREKSRAASRPYRETGPLPDRLEQMIRGFMPSRCILTALEIDLFTSIGEGADCDHIATAINASPDGVGRLLNALVALGLLTKTGNEYHNTPDTGRYFVRGSRDDQRDGLLHTASLWHTWSTLTTAVRRGTCIPVDHYSKHDWPRNFIIGMDRVATHWAPLVVNALGTSGIGRVLDLGGGSGAYSIALAKAAPGAHCEILDLPEVLPLTSEYVRKAGVSAQITLRAGDLLDDEFGTGYDLVMLNAICHMFSVEQNRDLLRRTFKALAPKGRLAVQDFILNREKTGPPQAALFSLNMLVGTSAGATYNQTEYFEWMNSAGFSEIHRIKLGGPADLIVGVR